MAAGAATLHVSAASITPTPPFETWETAAATIQDAVAIASPGDTVVVTNGTYNTGSVLTNGLSRVALTNSILVQSINGPSVTTIEGDTNGVRCVYVGNKSVLTGFTLTKGRAVDFPIGGGVLADPEATIIDCVLVDNSAVSGGGGGWGGVFRNCRFSRNRAFAGGAAQYSTLVNCTLEDNQATRLGGGTSLCHNLGCVITGNVCLQERPLDSPSEGGGTFGSTNVHCTITGNRAGDRGGGVRRGITLNSIVYFNNASLGANHDETTIHYSCTVPLPAGTGNIDEDPMLASTSHLAPQSPCIAAVLANFALGENGPSFSLHDIDGEPYATPPTMGADQPNAIPARATTEATIQSSHIEVGDGYRIRFSASHPGPILRGTWDFGDGTRLTNQAVASHAWTHPGDYTVRFDGFGDDNHRVVSGETQVAVRRSTHYVDSLSTNPTPPYDRWETAARDIQDAILAGTLPGRLVLVTNGVYRFGRTPADSTNFITLNHSVVVRSVNGPEVTILDGDGQVRCAFVGNDSVLDGFTLTNGNVSSPGVGVQFNPRRFQGAGAFLESHGKILNSVIQGCRSGFGGGGASGGTLEHCRISGNQAKNGAGAATWSTLRYSEIVTNEAFGDGGIVSDCDVQGCLIRGNSNSGTGTSIKSQLYDCTLDGNQKSGGGYQSLFVRCILKNNTSLQFGGGASRSTLYGCLVTGNSSERDGGGAYDSSLYNCTVVDNRSRTLGGGVARSALVNSIVYYNTAPRDPNHSNSSSLACCTAPLPSGDGNTAEAPQFVDRESGDFRLSPGSPCIAVGNTNYPGSSRDLLGLVQPRVQDGSLRVDLGAYVFALPTIPPVLSLNWQFIPPGILRLRWDPATRGARLQQTRQLQSGLWETIPDSLLTNSVDVPSTLENRFYRLITP